MRIKVDRTYIAKINGRKRLATVRSICNGHGFFNTADADSKFISFYVVVDGKEIDDGLWGFELEPVTPELLGGLPRKDRARIQREGFDFRTAQFMHEGSAVNA